MTDLAQLTHNLVLDPMGIWQLRTARTHVLSFPATGHATCMGIEDDSFWLAHRNACITAALGREHVEGPLLDIGGGNGAVSQAIEASGIEAVLLEPGPSGARNARARGLRDVVCATLEDADFQPGAFGPPACSTSSSTSPTTRRCCARSIACCAPVARSA